MYKENIPTETCMFVGGNLMRDFIGAGKLGFNREGYKKTPNRVIDISSGYTSRTVPGEQGLGF